MTRILIPRSDNISAKKIQPSDFELYFGCFVPDHIVSGLCVSIGAGLSVCVAAGVARLQGLILCNSATCNVSCLTNSATNKIYMHVCRDANCEVDEWTFGSTTGSVPADSLHIVCAVTSGGAVTTITDATYVASLGRQKFMHNMSTSARNALTWWEAQKLLFDTCTNLIYYNSDACAPTCVTWKTTGGFDKNAGWTSCPTSGDIIHNTTTCQIGIYKGESNPRIWHGLDGGIVYFKDDFTSYGCVSAMDDAYLTNNECCVGFTNDVTCNEIDFASPGQSKFAYVHHPIGTLSAQWVFRAQIDLDTMSQATTSAYWGIGVASANGINPCHQQTHAYINLYAHGSANLEKMGVGSGVQDGGYLFSATGNQIWSCTTLSTGTYYLELAFDNGKLTGKAFTCSNFSSQFGSTGTVFIANGANTSFNCFFAGAGESATSTSNIGGSIIWYEIFNGTTVASSA
jgi:hypothetical protein